MTSNVPIREPFSSPEVSVQDEVFTTRRQSAIGSVSEVARIRGVERDRMKTWSKEHALYLNLTDQPAKGQEQQFSEADLRVVAQEIADDLQTAME